MHAQPDAQVRAITRDDLPAVLDLLVAAFDDDPWFNYLAKQDAHRRKRLRGWLDRGLRRKTFPHGETYMATDGSGAALWIPPHTTTEGVGDTLELWLALVRTCGLTRARLVANAIRRIAACEPTTPHMELRLLAVSPHRRGEHIASALMRPMLDRCDRQRIPAALLCTKQENVPLYQHFGFRVTDTIALTDGPTLWQMLRTPAP